MDRRIPCALLLLAFAATACAVPGAGAARAPCSVAGVSIQLAYNDIDRVDLLLVVDNSNSMGPWQTSLLTSQFIDALTRPPDNNMDGHPDYPAVRDLHVGVVSTDLGTPGATVPGCASSDIGDDGLLNPIRNGARLTCARHGGCPRPTPADCGAPDQFPTFLAFDSYETDPTRFAHDFYCTASLGTNGCGLEQPLEAAYRAIVWHDASDRAGNTDPNAGFLRERALLAIIVLSDEEDGSVRDCRYAERNARPGFPPCEDAIDVYQQASTRWATPDLNRRFYLAQPGSVADPTWNLDRYVDPRDPRRGFLGLKPGHPERVMFSAITGVPLELPTRMLGGLRLTDWDALLGTPDPRNSDDFAGRDTRASIDESTPEGPISMRQSNPDPDCDGRMVPACRAEVLRGDPSRPPCTSAEQPFAWPARRIVEIARRMDESAICNGAPCRNGAVTSICRANYASALRGIVEQIGTHITARCLPRVLRQVDTPAGRIVQCVMRESVPTGASCDPARGRRRAIDDNGRPIADTDDASRIVCDIAQLPTLSDRAPDLTAHGCFRAPCAETDRAAVAGQGFFYDVRADPSQPNCRQRIAYTREAEPRSPSRMQLECIEYVTGQCP